VAACTLKQDAGKQVAACTLKQDAGKQVAACTLKQDAGKQVARAPPLLDGAGSTPDSPQLDCVSYLRACNASPGRESTNRSRCQLLRGALTRRFRSFLVEDHVLAAHLAASGLKEQVCPTLAVERAVSLT